MANFETIPCDDRIARIIGGSVKPHYVFEKSLRVWSYKLRKHRFREAEGFADICGSVAELEKRFSSGWRKKHR